jgi:RNA polymerase sigma factor (sigma-70 family)
MRAAADDLAVDAAEDDRASIARVLAGDSDAFAQIVARYQAGLYRYAISMVLDAEVASDMVQDAFVRAYVNLGTCRDHSRFRPWLFQTLRNRCLDHLKAAARRSVPLEAAESVPDSSAGPDEQIDRARARTELRRALAGLPAAQREAFVMHYVHDVPYDTLSNVLGASVSALKMRAMRARQALIDALAAVHVTRSSSVRLVPRGRLRSVQSATEEES